MVVRPVSVIICTQNRGKLIERIVNEIRAQDYPSDAFEIIVVDSSSSDHTLRVVERLATEPGVPIRYIHEPRLGIGFARNRGAEVACYPYLAYIDDDCSCRSGWLKQLMSGFDLHKNVVAVGGLVSVCWDRQDRPSWLGPELERWLGGNGFLGTHSRLLNEYEPVIECNMALERRYWQVTGGFLGMEQFIGTGENIASSEVVYLLHQLHHRGRKIAFIPEAIVYHHVGGRTRQWMLRRAYYQGVSDAILDYFLQRRSWATMASRIILDSAAMIVLYGYAALSFIRKDSAKGMFHLSRAIRRMSLLLSELHIVGDWHYARSWVVEQKSEQ